VVGWVVLCYRSAVACAASMPQPQTGSIFNIKDSKMSDSIRLFAEIDWMTEAEYEQAKYPVKGAEDDDESSRDFRD